ncbi:DUF1993 domain-containing protein [Parerythrobacter jejuensis]|uniref:DUF1993 family protein n=1 Tax=Parerythrobacter jejuensis TaxID=795812 RepID=A0A845AQY6_9SPHN|nr:DUF1993 domain-containing protein [Parerythrobacter jejuensis]MXP30916.1 DUF1993 family protein [Parerythrobacter jejuensis]MXP33676.1 DUF1993 family protein [Parerythrobacter jejuensis]
MSLYDLAIPTYRNMLQALDRFLAKAEDHSEGDALLAERLSEDMHPLSTQVRFVTNLPFEGLQRLTGKPFTSLEEDPETLAASRKLVAEALQRLATFTTDDFPAADTALEMEIPNGMTFDLTAEQHLRDWSFPNFYFHTSAAYAILRMKGIPLGKLDLMGHMMPYLRQPTPA